MLKLSSMLLAVLAVSGCAGTFEEARLAGMQERAGSLGAPRTDARSSSATERCQALDNQRTTWGAAAKGAAVLAGGTGISTIPLEDRDAQIAMAATSAGVAAFGVVALYVAEQKGAAWARECSTP